MVKKIPSGKINGTKMCFSYLWAEAQGSSL